MAIFIPLPGQNGTMPPNLGENCTRRKFSSSLQTGNAPRFCPEPDATLFFLNSVHNMPLPDVAGSDFAAGGGSFAITGFGGRERD